jgi:tetratricopeptide (TPR) repeat protein
LLSYHFHLGFLYGGGIALAIIWGYLAYVAVFKPLRVAEWVHQHLSEAGFYIAGYAWAFAVALVGGFIAWRKNVLLPLRALTCLVENNPNDASCFWERALFLRFYTRDLRRALQDLDRAIELDPADPWYYGDRASAHLAARHWPEVVRDSTSAIMLADEWDKPAWRAWWFYHLRAYALYKLRDFRRAIDDFSQVIHFLEITDDDDKHRGDLAAAYYLRAIAHLRRKERTEAKSDFSEAHRLDPWHLLEPRWCRNVYTYVRLVMILLGLSAAYVFVTEGLISRIGDSILQELGESDG